MTTNSSQVHLTRELSRKLKIKGANRILILEDRPDTIEGLIKGLEDRGMLVLLTDDPQTAHWIAKTTDLIAMCVDLNLTDGGPGLDLSTGVEFVRDLRSNGNDTPVLVTSAFTGEVVEEELLRANAGKGEIHFAPKGGQSANEINAMLDSVAGSLPKPNKLAKIRQAYNNLEASVIQKGKLAAAIVAIIGFVVLLWPSGSDPEPSGIQVKTVAEDIGGTRIFAVAGDWTPVAYVANGSLLRVECMVLTTGVDPETDAWLVRISEPSQFNLDFIQPGEVVRPSGEQLTAEDLPFCRP